MQRASKSEELVVTVSGDGNGKPISKELANATFQSKDNCNKIQRAIRDEMGKMKTELRCEIETQEKRFNDKIEKLTDTIVDQAEVVGRTAVLVEQMGQHEQAERSVRLSAATRRKTETTKIHIAVASVAVTITTLLFTVAIAAGWIG